MQLTTGIKSFVSFKALLACGFWQMSEGIELFAIKYSAEDKLSIAYWVWIAVMLVCLLGGAFFRYKMMSSNNDDDVPPVAEENAPVVSKVVEATPEKGVNPPAYVEEDP